MKGIILHGGSGTGLRPFTYTDAKQLVPIAGKSISEYALENLTEHEKDGQVHDRKYSLNPE